ncbi:E3 ubiquitin-protein ligase-like [Cheilinus undulatus]|uniref:E3 ubiquitin-protein ligase-like n=1 Tax=Cheilinus undulatus TaxID=241271 RepID=UPI001BD354F6|nr:E3 ubiquitin-protein ligase-like [Cheilinus undulatus]
MYSELECGICYRIYNAGRRCPRELHCKHSFCESCLLALSRAPPRGGAGDEARLGADRSIVCPLCRHTTSIPGDRRIRVELRVDEDVLERLLAVGVLDREDEDDQEEEEEEGRVLEGSDDNEERTLPGTTAEESNSSPGSRGGRLRRSWSKVWRTISGRSSRQNCMTNDDMRNLAMMASYMF